MAAMGRKSMGEMAGEFLRELGVLVVVFAPFELRSTFSRLWIIGTMALGVVCWMVGAWMETRRRE
jgi:hypothetical protein